MYLNTKKMGSRIKWINSAVTTAYRFNSRSYIIEGKIMFMQRLWVSSTTAVYETQTGETEELRI